MKYKYHYVIKNKYGEVVDTAKDKLTKRIMLSWLLKSRGYLYAITLKVERKRISVDEWKARYF